MADSALEAMTADRDYWRAFVTAGATSGGFMLDAIFARCCAAIDCYEVGYYLAVDILTIAGAKVVINGEE